MQLLSTLISTHVFIVELFAAELAFQGNTIQYNKNLFKRGKIIQY